MSTAIGADWVNFSHERSNYDLRGKPVTHVNLGMKGTVVQNVQTIVSTIDAEGNVTLRLVDSKPVTLTYGGEAKILTEFHYGQQPTTLSYDGAGRRVTSISGAVVSTFQYDVCGRLATISVGPGYTTYSYDARGKLASKVGGALRTTLTCNDLGESQLTIAPDGARTTYVYNGDGRRVAQAQPGGSLTTLVYVGDDLIEEIS